MHVREYKPHHVSTTSTTWIEYTKSLKKIQKVKSKGWRWPVFSIMHTFAKNWKGAGLLLSLLLVDIWSQPKHMQPLSLSYLSRAPSRLALSLLQSIRPKSLVQKLSDKLSNHTAAMLSIWSCGSGRKPSKKQLCILMHQQQITAAYSSTNMAHHRKRNAENIEFFNILWTIFVLAWFNPRIALWHPPTNTRQISRKKQGSTTRPAWPLCFGVIVGLCFFNSRKSWERDNSRLHLKPREPNHQCDAWSQKPVVAFEANSFFLARLGSKEFKSSGDLQKNLCDSKRSNSLQLFPHYWPCPDRTWLDQNMTRLDQS